MSEHIGDTDIAANCTPRTEQCDVKKSLPLKKAIPVIRNRKYTLRLALDSRLSLKNAI